VAVVDDVVKPHPSTAAIALEEGNVLYAINNARLSDEEEIFYLPSIVYRSDFYTFFYVVS